MKNLLDWGMFIATSLMALFALFSWLTALSQKKSQERLLKQQQISQERLLNKQNEIQQKQLQLALLKEKQEIRECFRRLIISIKKDLSDVVYMCKEMTLQDLMENTVKDYVIFMRINDLFGRKLKVKADKLIGYYEDILSFETQQISKLRLFERGLVHHDREKKLSPNLLKTYKEVYNKNTRNLIEANKLFSEILQEMSMNINKITQNLQV